MKKNINVIQIKGIKGLMFAIFVVVCLAAGFIAFPSIVAMKLWNMASGYIESIPAISIYQGVLLWGIIVASYYTFRKERLIVCMKGSDGLDEEELKAVFSDIKQQMKTDAIIQNMIKARETELKIKNLSESNIPQNDIKDKIESK